MFITSINYWVSLGVGMEAQSSHNSRLSNYRLCWKLWDGSQTWGRAQCNAQALEGHCQGEFPHRGSQIQIKESPGAGAHQLWAVGSSYRSPFMIQKIGGKHLVDLDGVPRQFLARRRCSHQREGQKQQIVGAFLFVHLWFLNIFCNTP